MTTEEAKRRLRLFEIPSSDTQDGESVRGVLARLIAAWTLTFADAQIVRDIVGEARTDDPWICLFIAAMRLSLMGGNTFLDAGKGGELLRSGGYLDTLGTNDETNAEYGEKVCAYWTEHVEPAIRALSQDDVSRYVVCHEVNVSDKNGMPCRNVHGWFFAKIWDAVKTVSDILGEMAGGADLQALTDAEVADAVRFAGKDGNALVLNEDQIKAIEVAARRRFAVVTGGPGTGKTTVVCAILRALMSRGEITGEDIALVAPTGRAAQRMGEALHAQCANAIGMDEVIASQINELSGATIHSLLGGLPSNWKYTAQNRLPYGIVIVDEASMVDVNLMQALLEALKDNCRLVLLGDKNQLPSVDAGAVLGDVVAGFGESTVVTLKKSNRFTETFAKCAEAVNEGDVDEFKRVAKSLPTADEKWTVTLSRSDADNVNRVFRYVLPDGTSIPVLQRLVMEWARHFGLLSSSESEGELVRFARSVTASDKVFDTGEMTPAVKALFGQLDRSRILTVLRNGPYGAAGINGIVVMNRFGGRMPANPLTEVGVPVIVTCNSRARNLWNGDVGVTVMGPDGMVALFPRGDNVAVCPVGLLPEHELAYAMTIHKSQGSEFENVLVVLPSDRDNPLLSRPLLYTGVTRAKLRAVVMGTGSVIASTLENDFKRDSGLVN